VLVVSTPGSADRALLGLGRRSLALLLALGFGPVDLDIQGRALLGLGRDRGHPDQIQVVEVVDEDYVVTHGLHLLVGVDPPLYVLPD